MPTGVISPLASERRKEYRVQVRLRGKLHSGGRTIPLEIGDISPSGALVLLKGAPNTGTGGELWIEEYGPIAVEVKHSGSYFCGVAFAEPDRHQHGLTKWLTDERGKKYVFPM